MKRISLTLPDTLFEKLKIKTSGKYTSKQEFIRQVLLEKLQEDKEIKETEEINRFLELEGGEEKSAVEGSNK
jgi:metal-responsive CopG/Arc/MetJ family transcriptional regulator